MDTSASGKSKGGTPNRPLTSRPSLSRNTKTGSPTPSPKVATDSPRPATRGAGLIPKPTATKVATAVKEANAAKSNTVRTITSPNKSKSITHRDPASPMKPPAKQTTRPQNGEKGAQQTASLLVTKNGAAKKTAEGAQLNKPKPGQEGGNATPSKRNGIANKREVGKLPENGSVPKDKTLCLRPETSASVPSKPLATASSPTKTLKASSISYKPKQIVPPPEKPVNATSLSSKATKSPVTSTRPSAPTSTTAKPVKTASPLVKTPRPTPVSAKATKTPSSPVKPVNTLSAPAKPRSATTAKPPGNTVPTNNQIKVGKRLPTTTKATSVPAKQVNNAPTAIRPVKSSTAAHKSMKEEGAEVTPVVNEVSQILSAESLQVVNSEASNIQVKETEKIAELEKLQEPPIVAEQVVSVPVNNVIENTTVDVANTGGELLKESELPLDTNKSISPTAEISVETHSQDKETQLLIPVTEETKSPTKEVILLEEEVIPSITEEPMSESSSASVEPLYEEQKGQKPIEEQSNVPSEHLQEPLKSPLERTHFTMEATNPFEEQPNVPSKYYQAELRPPLELGIFLKHPVNDVYEGVHIPSEELNDKVASSIEPSKETEELLTEENRSLDENQVVCMERDIYLNQSEKMPNRHLDEETFTAECVEPLEDVVTSSLEQVTPLEEEAVLSEDELQPVEQRDVSQLEEEYKNSSKSLNQQKISPVDLHNPLELLTSSTEELTPSEEEVEHFKDEKHMEDVACKMDLAEPKEIATFSMEPVVCSQEEISSPKDPFGEAITNEAESITALEKEMVLNETLQSSDEVVKHSKEGNSPSPDLLQSSFEEVRLSEEPPMLSVETLQPSFEEVKSSEEEAMRSREPLQTSVKEVKLSEEEPLSVEPLQSSVEADQSSQEQRLSVEPQQTAVEEVKSPQEDSMLSKEPPESSVESDRSLGGEPTSPLLLLRSSFEPLDSSMEKFFTSFDPLKGTKEGITSLKETTRLEGSQSPVQLPDPSQLLVSLENTKELSNELIEEEGNASSENEGEEILLTGQQGHLIDQFDSIIEPVRYDAEILVFSTAESLEHVEQGNKAANMDPEEIQERLPVGSELFEEPLDMMHEPDHGSSKHAIATEKQLHSAKTDVENISNPIKLGQSVQESVLFPEEPLTSMDASKTTSVKAAGYPEKPIKSSLELVKRADYDEEATKLSIHELTGYPEDLPTSPEKSMDIESINVNTIAPALPYYQENLVKLESAMLLTSEDDALFETSVETQVNEPLLPVMASVESLPLVEEPTKHEVLIQPEEPEDETNMPVPTTEETNFSIRYHVNQREGPESFTSTENQHNTAELESITDLEKSPVDSDFYVTMDPAEQVSDLYTKQDIEMEIEEKKTPKLAVYVLEEPIEGSLEPIDNTTDVPEQTDATEIREQTIPTEGGKPTREFTGVGYSDECTSILHTEASALQHTHSPATNTISMLPIEQDVEVSKTSDLLAHPLQNIYPWDHPQATEREPWVLVKMDELSDFTEEPEESLLRPASLNQDAEVQDEQKAEEELVERASVCSTLSDPQLAAKSSSETSTPEELRTYEDSSSGVESHSDDAATSPQTTLTPDPDLGIHMGQEEGAETPAGTPASNKGVPPPLQIVDIEGQSQSTSPSGIFDPSENNQIVRKKEMTASTESREHDYEESAKERGAQRGNDD